MKMLDFSKLDLTNKSDDELFDLAQNFTTQFVTLRDRLKEFSMTYHFELDEKENTILNQVYSCLREKREEQLSCISSEIPSIIKRLVSNMDNTNMDEVLTRINKIKLLNEQGKFVELLDVINSLNIPRFSASTSTCHNLTFGTEESRELTKRIQYIDGPWLFKKQVDKSVLKQGLVIRSDKQDDFFNAMGHRMEPRTSEYLFFMVGDDKYEVKILYSLKSSGSTQLSVYYGEDLQRRFQKEFPKSYRSIMAKRENMEIKHGVFAKVDKGKEEYIEIYKTDNPKIFRVKCIPLSD